MKTKNLFRIAAIMLTVAMFAVTACKKDKKDDPEPDSSSLQQLSKDEGDVDNASNEGINDVSNILSGGNGKSLEGWPCNVTIDSATILNDSIVDLHFIWFVSKQKYMEDSGLALFVLLSC